LLPSILADENIDKRIITSLRESQIKILSITEIRPGISDLEAMELARENKAVILTEDNDFGELIFSYKYREVGVIFIRFIHTDLNKIIRNIISVISKYQESLYSKFVVITPDKIRIREL
jgi:predicted nuclease of predicted toxin-antitoxin system